MIYLEIDWYGFLGTLTQLSKDVIDMESIQGNRRKLTKEGIDLFSLVRLHNLPWKWLTWST
jgi:hypothetical protein